MNPEQWLSLKWNGGSTMSDRWLNQSKIIQRRIKTRYAGKRVTFKTKISVWLTWRTFNRIMYSKSKSKSNTKNKGESKKSKKDPQMHQSGQNIKNKRKEKVKTICNKNTK